MLKRLFVITVATLLVCSSPARAQAERVDFDLFDTTQAIGEGAIGTQPADGETLLLQFWASWCHSCSALMWDMDEITSANDNVRYVAVSIDDDQEAARTYIRKHRLFEKYRDRYFVDSEKALSTALEITTVPTILLVNSRGDVLVRKSGHLNASDFQDFSRAMHDSR